MQFLYQSITQITSVKKKKKNRGIIDYIWNVCIFLKIILICE